MSLASLSIILFTNLLLFMPMLQTQDRANSVFKSYVSLTKPGIIWGNVIAATGGFMFAAQGQPDLLLYLLTMLGTCLIVASGCVFNNVIDTDIDSLMDRTKKRALVEGKINKTEALFFGAVLGVSGFAVLLLFTNIYAFFVGLFGFYVYVVMYSVFYKRKSVHGTLIGSASGASPPVIGYVAVSGQLDLAALLIFVGFCAWQMPHSYAIAMFRKSDYQASSIPLLPLVKGIRVAQKQMVIYILLFALTIVLLFTNAFIAHVTAALLLLLCGYWLYKAVILFKPNSNEFDDVRWGKQQFVISIIVVTTYSMLMSIDYLFK